MKFSNSYVQLSDVFYERTDPTPVQDPALLLWNTPLAEQLQVGDTLKEDPATLAQAFGGNQTIPGSEPIAMAYAGHQFGGFVMQLGDGRAHLLGEVLDQDGGRQDIQLKGSGRTRFSRGGDGRCALGPAIREFIMSEAIYALGIPTTRSLAVVTTGEQVIRERATPGAIVTRVASSHLRVGSFEYFAARSDYESLATLADYAIGRHDPQIDLADPKRYVQFAANVIERQIRLIVDWMRVGFIHGVMNTDNTAISGETIDYGPCAMMGIFDPKTVFSSIDANGRYAFSNQPHIAQWNMARFVECLLRLIDTDMDNAVKQVEPLIAEFSNRFQDAHLQMMRNKLGLTTTADGDLQLVQSILESLQSHHMDHTITFDRLTRSVTTESVAAELKQEIGEPFEAWRHRLTDQDSTPKDAAALMRQNNPVVIPRNHHVEAILEACEQSGEASSAEAFLNVLRTPYEQRPETETYQDAPCDGDVNYRTFCGT
jgi:uncharacterized protein YdiU (UPF0061 family)